MENQHTGLSHMQQSQAAKMVDLSIILVCWNNKNYLEPCLNSLYESGLKSSFDVVVVDNGSTDGSQDMLREKFPQVKIMQNEGNVGLGKASNQGIEATNSRHVLLLNNDTLVNGPSFDAMVEYLDNNPRVGAVAGKLLNPDGTVQSCYNSFPSLFEEFMIATRLGEYFWPGYPGVITGDEVKSVDWMSSACLMVRRAVLDRVGLLDEEYFIYGDEMDLQYRFKKNGWEMVFLPHATTIHYGGRSMNRWSRRKMVYRGHLMFYKKNLGPIRTAVLRTMLAGLSLGKVAIWGVAYLLPGKQEQARKELESNLDVVKLCWNLA